MLKKVAVIGVTAAAIVGTGTAALAVTGSNSATPAPSASSSTPATGKTHTGSAARHPELARLRDLVHASWVTQNKKTGAFTTHEAIKGTVGSVSATSITVTAADTTSETYTVNSSTKVHTRAQRKGAVIADVKVGDTVVVAGTGTSSVVATQIVDSAK